MRGVVAHDFSCGQVPQLGRVVRGGGDQVHRVRREHAIPHPPLMLEQTLLQLPGVVAVPTEAAIAADAAARESLIARHGRRTDD